MKKIVTLILIAFAFSACLTCTVAKDYPEINVLLFTGGEIHNYKEIGDALEQGLKAYGRFNITRVMNDLDYFAAADLTQFDAIVFEYTVGTISEAQKRPIMNFVAQGKGFAAIHSTTDSFRGDPDWRAFMSAHFIRHPPYRDFQVSVNQPDHPIMQGFPVEFIARDEMYIMDYDPRLNILCASYYQGEVVPVAFTKEWGKGRIFYQSFGHDGAGAARPYAMRMLGRALLWVANQENLDMHPDAPGFIGKYGFVSAWHILGGLKEPEDSWENNRFGKTLPDVAQPITADGEQFKWLDFRAESPSGDVDLKKLYPPDVKFVVAYACAEIELAKSTKGYLKIGSNDGVMCWLNGKRVHSNIVKRNLTVDEDVVPVKFKAGKNQLMLKIVNYGGDWGFSCRVADENGKAVDLLAGE
ncbi:ThuA domain-containing protein [candidate division KSB1 bacterium]|nr:ThuA domain-containing protein [candidate division KSB1 bacterium]